jgi:hypothetical protein
MLAAACRSWLKHLFRALEREPACRRSRIRTLGLESLEDRTLLSTFFVVNAGDPGTGCANHGDLRYCITQANATPGLNVIAFALPGTGGQTIHLQSSLPALTNTVFLDGWSQRGTGYGNTVASDIIGPGADGNGLTGTAPVIEPNVPPSVAVMTAPPSSVAENTDVSASGTFSDYDHPVTITASEGTITQTGYTGGTWNWSEAAPLNEGAHTVTITATDSYGATSSTNFTFMATEAPPAVAVTTAPPSSVVEDTNINASGTFSDYDDGVTITASEGSISQTGYTGGTWSWSEAAPLNEGAHTVTITATDEDGATSSTNFTFTATEAPPTVAVTTAPPSSVAENTNVSASGAFSDYDDLVTITASEGTVTQTSGTSGSWSWSETAPLNEGAHTVTITATDEDGATNSTNFTFTVTDAAPSVSADKGAVTAPENQSATNTGAWSDYDDTVTLSASSGNLIQNSNGTWSWSGTGDESNNGTVTITATNSDGSTATTSFNVSLTDVAPSVVVTTSPTSLVVENATVSAGGSFSDYDDSVTLSASEGSISQTGNTNGTWSWSETAPLSDGLHKVTITATNSDGSTSSTNFTFTVTDVAPSVTFAGNSGLVAVNAGQPLSLTGSFTDPDGDQGTGTVNYGDGSGVQPLALAPNHTFTLHHTYQQEGSYLVTVEVTDEGGASDFASILIEVFNSGVDLTQIKRATADSPTSSDPGITATLHTTSATASLLLAPITPSAVVQPGGAFQAEGLGTFVSAYDIRSVDLTAQDKVVMTFQFSPGRGTPALEYFDSSSQSFKPILGSTIQPNSFAIDPVRGTITLVLDESSTPRLTDLTRTVFVVSIPQAQLSPSVVSPPPTLPQASEPSVAAQAATTGTATPSTLNATGLPSGTSSLITPANTQTVSNNSSVNELSAFSPFIFFTPLHAGTSGGEANVGAEANLFIASIRDILSLLNRLPPAPPSEESFTPPNSEPKGVLSPSRAGFPEGTDGAEAPGQAPAPITPPPANNPPRSGLRFRPAGHETTNGHEMKLDEDRSGDASWLDEALSELFERLTWHANGSEGEDARVHPAVAVLVLCARFVPRAAQRTMPPSRSRARSGRKRGRDA